MENIFREQIIKEELKSKIEFDWIHVYDSYRNSKCKTARIVQNDDVPECDRFGKFYSELRYSRNKPVKSNIDNKIIVNLIPCSKFNEEKKNDEICNSPIKSTAAILPKMSEDEYSPLSDSFHLKAITDDSDIPNEIDKPVPQPYISLMSPQLKSRGINPNSNCKNFSSKVLQRFHLTPKKL